MIKLNRIGLGKSWSSVPGYLKFIIFLLILFGVWGRSCARNNELKKIIFFDVSYDITSLASIEVFFNVENKTLYSGKKPILIEVYTNNGNLVASKLTNIEIEAKQTKKYVLVLDKFERALRVNESIGEVKICLYQRKVI